MGIGGVEGEGRDKGAAAEVRPGRRFRVHFCANTCRPDQCQQRECGNPKQAGLLKEEKIKNTQV